MGLLIGAGVGFLCLLMVFALVSSFLPVSRGESGELTQPKPPGKSPEPEITDSNGMKLVLVKAGKFILGSPNDEKERGEGETQHEVEITRDFHMGVHEIT